MTKYDWFRLIHKTMGGRLMTSSGSKGVLFLPVALRLSRLQSCASGLILNRLRTGSSLQSAQQSQQIAALRDVLTKRSVNHFEEIMLCNSLKDAHIYCKTNSLSGQITGPLIERYMRGAFHMTKINASACAGDLRCEGVNYELKISNGGMHNNKFNYVQLRMNHDCRYILTAYYLDGSNVEQMGELFVFRLDKEALRRLVLEHGSYAHGTKRVLGSISEEDLNRSDNKKEYCLRPVYDDACWKALLKYRVPESRFPRGALPRTD